MATLATDWRKAITDTDGDDTPMLVYCDWLDENAQEELSAILRQWLVVRTSVRMSYEVIESSPEFDKQVAAYNAQFPEFAETEIIERRKAWMTGRIGGCYTHLHATPEYLRRRPNLISDQPFRSLTLLASRAEQSDLDDVMTNWRLGKLWHIDIPFYAFWGNSEEKLVQMIRVMKPLPCLNYLSIRGVRNINFKLSSNLIGLKKVPKGCRIKLGSQKELVA